MKKVIVLTSIFWLVVGACIVGWNYSRPQKCCPQDLGTTIVTIAGATIATSVPCSTTGKCWTGNLIVATEEGYLVEVVPPLSGTLSNTEDADQPLDFTRKRGYPVYALVHLNSTHCSPTRTNFAFLYYQNRSEAERLLPKPKK